MILVQVARLIGASILEMFLLSERNINNMGMINLEVILDRWIKLYIIFFALNSLNCRRGYQNPEYRQFIIRFGEVEFQQKLNLNYYILIRMNKISSLIQIKMYKPVGLHANTHKLLAKKLKFFTPDSEYRHLSYTYWFETTRYQSVLQKMSRIGWFADQICHHPQWKLMDKNLQVVISTHDIGNRISLKDYILAEFIELVLQGKDIQKQLFEKWNKNKVILSQLSPQTSNEQGKK